MLVQVKVLKCDKVVVCDKGLKLLECVGLFVYVNKFLVQFFGGQQQCVVIVCVLCMDFIVMLFDELIFVFDLEMINEVLDVMVELVNEGMIMMVVMYEMGFVCKVVNWVIFMDEGKIVEDLLKEEFFVNFSFDCVKDFFVKILY